jgi:NADH:ubiquinone oxidoreductase subunit 3 (subunit A)
MLPVEEMRNVNWYGLSKSNATTFGIILGKFNDAFEKFNQSFYLFKHTIVVFSIIMFFIFSLSKEYAIDGIIILMCVDMIMISLLTFVKWVNQDVLLSQISIECKKLPQVKKDQ